MPIAADLYYHEYSGDAEGPPVILIHGAGGNHLHWPPQVRRLPGWRVLALDLPGHGKSPGRSRQTIEALTECVQEWASALDLPPAVYVGHSMGSAIALTLAIERPQRVKALGLLGASSRLRVNPNLMGFASNETTFPKAVTSVVEWSFGPEAPERLKELATERMLETRPTVLHSDFLACAEFDRTECIREIKQPTLIVAGSADRMVPPRESRFLADNMPNARLEIVPDAGHMVMLEQPEEVARLLQEFLGSCCDGV